MPPCPAGRSPTENTGRVAVRATWTLNSHRWQARGLTARWCGPQALLGCLGRSQLLPSWQPAGLGSCWPGLGPDCWRMPRLELCASSCCGPSPGSPAPKGRPVGTGKAGPGGQPTCPRTWAPAGHLSHQPPLSVWIKGCPSPPREGSSPDLCTGLCRRDREAVWRATVLGSLGKAF